ncbi:MAG: hypothetical protein C0P61_002610 [Bacillota bacterium]|nr:hypothetical protein [Bacillota bacterium]
MRRHFFVRCAACRAAAVLAALAAAVWPSLALPAGAAQYQVQVTIQPGEPESYVVEHTLQVPIGDPQHAIHGNVGLRRTSGPALSEAWGGTLSLKAGRAAVFAARNEDHRSSTEPFRLLHKSSRMPEAWSGAIEWRGPWSILLQYVQAVSLRGRPGPVLAAQGQGPAPWPRLTWVGYGSDVLQHHFFVLDGSLTVSRSLHLSWGAAWQQGLEAAGTSGQPSLAPVRETAAFARVDAARGRHRIRMTVHRTSDGFRSLVADDYPFARGRIGLEGRWQFRPRTNHLLSVYGQWLTPVGDQFAAAQEVEVRYSVSPRQRWAWYAGAAWELEAESEPAVTWQAGVRDPRRRLDASLEATASGDGVRWRPRVEGQAPDWRLRFTADSEFSGWRAQWVYTGHPFWEVTAVYKERRQGSGSPGWRSWTYVRLLRRVPGFGEVWMQWNDWDQGRLDVGWSRPVTVAAGISIAF